MLKKLLVLLALFSLALSAQDADKQITDDDIMRLEETPVFKVDVVSKSVPAVNYRVQSGSTRVDFEGTALMPRASGQAKVQGRQGRINIDADLRNMGLATQFGAEYLTYVMWAVSPEGRAANLGEVILNKSGRAKLKVTSELQVFGLIITAEPYFSVSQPSDLVVLQNELRKNTKGRVHMIDAQFELLRRGQYEKLANPLGMSLNLKETPLEVYQARNAVQVAKSVGAAEWAQDIYKKAEAGLQMAENAIKTKDQKVAIQHARGAAQNAEDAREVAMRRIEQARIEKQQRDADEAARRADEAARQANEAAKKAEAERLAEAERRAKAEAASIAAEKERMHAELEAARAATKRAEADAARAAALLDRQRAEEAAAAASRAAALSAEEADAARREKQELRQRLLDLFNNVLETRDSDRGLIVNMSDVLFDVGKFNLRPVAREKLARLAGILMAYPGLKMECEGHTDITGSLELNQRLSLQRATAVQDYLIEQGIETPRISAVGKGPDVPVASNDTREGRQKNRRVEIIVSGEVIGTAIGGGQTF
jgi:outer membrane protein OmpA-like peptidoglycan-associated protein